jgi:hypothetical protein
VLTASLESENRFLNEQVATLQKDVESHWLERERLRRTCRDRRREPPLLGAVRGRRAAEHDLASLYVASYRLHATLDRGEALSIVQDIICNLIGSEEIAIFEADDSGAGLSLVASSGSSPALPPVPLGRGVIGAARGRPRST